MMKSTKRYTERTVAVSELLTESERLAYIPLREKPSLLKARFCGLSVEKQAAIIGMAEAFSFVQAGEESTQPDD
jgi:hypothetical protein